MRIPANAVRGAALLDERLPGWRAEIDVDRLDLGNTCNCVLGELFGSYDRGLKMLGLYDSQAGALGFFKRGRQTWSSLTAGWRALIARGS